MPLSRYPLNLTSISVGKAKTHRKCQLCKDLAYDLGVLLHFLSLGVPVSVALPFLETRCCSYLCRPGCCEAQYDVRVLDASDEVPWACRVACAPAGGVEGFEDRVDGDSIRCTCKGEACEERESGAVGKVLVYFIGEDDEIVSDGDIADGG